MAAKLVEPEVQRWLTAISQYEKEFKDWERRTVKVIERYTDKKSQQRKTARFNVLWSNVQTLVPACFSRLPKPDVSRRYRDNDPVGRVAALLLERALGFEVQHYPDYRAALRNVVQDRFLGARGTSWVRYEPHMKAQAGQPEDGVQATEDIDEPTEVIDYECAPVDYVHWRDFGHRVARTWEEVDAVWRKVYMGRDALIERFGEELGAKIPLDTRPEDLKKPGALMDTTTDAQALIYEIWDKSSGEALWLSKSLGEFVDRRPDPLELENFWPCPRPLFGTLTSDSLVPIPDIVFYQDQADSCDTLAERITGLIKALQVKGVYDASVPELARLFSEGVNNDLIPVKNFNAFSEKQGLKGAIDLVDLTPIFNALTASYEAFSQQLDQIYQITGIADIIRGDTDADETLGAQQIKGQFATLRIRDSQRDVAEYATELLRIKAQIICNKFQPETIMMIASADQLSEADKQYLPQALAMLKSASMRAFRIEVEADSLVQLDENNEKQQRIEFLGAVGGYLDKAIKLVEVAPEVAPLAVQMLKYGVTAFKVGKTLEGDIDQALDQLKQAQSMPKPQPPDPEMVKVQGQMQLQAAKDQSTAQLKQLELQFADQQSEREAQRQMQLEQWKQSMQAQQVQHQNELEAQRATLELQHQATLEQMKRDHEAAMKAADLEFQRWKTQQDNERAVVVAQIAAESKTQTAAIGAVAGADSETEPKEEKPDTSAALMEAVASLSEQFKAMKVSRIERVRGPDGKLIGARRHFADGSVEHVTIQ